MLCLLLPLPRSPSSRRAWIEISRAASAAFSARVALLAEGVDRNNHNRDSVIGRIIVALLAEGVDRNFQHKWVKDPKPWSPSSRRAWIEITR